MLNAKEFEAATLQAACMPDALGISWNTTCADPCILRSRINWLTPLEARTFRLNPPHHHIRRADAVSGALSGRIYHALGGFCWPACPQLSASNVV